MDSFDPWTATLEDAQKLPTKGNARDPVFQWATALELTSKKELIVADGFEVLAAVAHCALHGLVIPEWLTDAFLKRYRAVNHLKAASWDDDSSFGKHYKEGTQIAALRRKRLNKWKVVNAVADAIKNDPQTVIDNFFWEQIGKSIGEGKSNAQKLHAMMVRSGITKSPGEIKKQYQSHKVWKTRGITELPLFGLIVVSTKETTRCNSKPVQSKPRSTPPIKPSRLQQQTTLMPRIKM